MALSTRDRRVFDRIVTDLCIHDPDFAATVRVAIRLRRVRLVRGLAATSCAAAATLTGTLAPTVPPLAGVSIAVFAIAALVFALAAARPAPQPLHRWVMADLRSWRHRRRRTRRSRPHRDRH